MTYRFTPYSLTLFCTTAIALIVAFVVWRRRTVSGTIYLALLELAVAAWALGGAFEAAAVGIPLKLLWSKISYLGIASSPLFYFLFTFEYSQHRARLSPRTVALLSVLPASTVIIAATNDWHHWLWTDISLDQAYNVAVYGHGTWFWVFVAYTYVLLSVGVISLYRAMFRFPAFYRSQMGTLLVGSALPFAGNIVYVLGLSPVPGMDLTPISFAMTGIVLAWGILRHQMFRLAPIAHSHLIESMPDGVLVLDVHDRIVDLNPAAQGVVGDPVSEVIGQPVSQVFPDWPDLVERCRKAPGGYAKVVLDGQVRHHVELRLSPVYDRQRHLIGQLVVLHDITVQKQAELALQESEERLHTLIENIPGSFWAMDATGHYIVQNSTNRKIYGNSIGLDLDEIAVDEQLKATWRALNERVFQGERVTAEHEIELEGEKRIFHQVVAPVRIEERVVAIQGIGWDITEEQRTARAQHEHEQFLATLNEITRSALESPDLQAMLQTLANRMGELFAADGAYLTMWDEATQMTITGAAYGAWRDRYRSVKPEPGEVTLTESVLRAGHPLAIEDAHDTPYLSKRIAEMFPDRSLLGLPLIADGRKLGAALIAYNDTRHFTEAEIARGEQVARQISLALAKTYALQIEREQRERNEALSSIIAQVAVATDLQTLLETALDRLLGTLHLNAGVIWLPPHLIVRGLPVGSAEIDQVIQSIGFEVTGPLVTTDWEQVDAQSELAPTAGMMRRLGIRSTLLVPLFTGGLMTGGIGLVAFEPRMWAVQEISLAMAVGHQVGVAGHRQQIEEALLESEERFRTLVEGSVDGILVHRNTKPLFVNPTYARILGYESPDEILSMDSVVPLIAPYEQERLLGYHAARRRSEPAPSQYEYDAICRDGSVVTLQQLVTTISWDGEPAVLAAIVDITERKQAETALERYADRLEALHELDRDILTAQSVQATATSALRHLRQVVPCGRSSVFQVDTETGHLQMLAEIQTDGTESKMTKLDIALSPAYLATLQGEHAPIVRAKELPSGTPGRKAMQAHAMEVAVVVPLLAQGQLIGITALELLGEQQLSQSETQIVQEVADSLAIGLYQARLHAQTVQDAQIKAELLREVNHRVGNNLTAIIGLMHAEERYLSSKHGDAIENVLARLVQRVEGMAEVHHMLSSTQWSPLRLDHLVYQIIQVALNALPAHQTIQTTVTPAQVTVSPRQASMLALIVNELTTNTIKHAMVGRGRGKIDVAIDVDRNKVRLQFGNDGPDYPDEVLELESYDVGLYLIRQLTLSLPGELSLSNDSGAVTTIVFECEARSSA